MSGAGAVVLVRGGFVDGSGWEPVHRVLRQHGHDVSVVFERGGARVHRGVRAGRGRIGEHADRRSAARAPVPPILPPRDGFLFLARDRFHASFAADVPVEQAAFMADSQVPWGVEALGGTIGEPAWRSRPSWYLVASDDRMIPPPAQRSMAERAGATTVEVAGSHSVFLSQPAAVAELIERAASAVRSVAR